MANEIGSFVVSIKAQIEGYQEQIAAIKSKLEEIGKDTNIGREIAKSLKLAESQVNHLGRAMEKRISSESQITTLTDNLQNISRLIMDIGDSFGKVTWDDLNTDGLRDKIQSAKTEIDELANSIQKNVSKGFTEALAVSTEMREIFKSLKIDPAEMGAEEVTEKLRIGLAAATADLQKYKTELEDISQKANEATQNMHSIGLNKSNAEDAKKDLNTIFQNLQLIATEKISINHEQIGNLFDELTSFVDNFDAGSNNKLKEIKDKLREFSYDLINETDPAKLKEHLQQINDAFKELNGKSLASNIEGYGSRIESIFKNLTITDIDKSITGLKEFKAALNELFSNNNNFGMNDTEAKNFIEKVINVEATKESIEAAKKEVSALITNYLNGINQTYKEASKTANNFNTQKGAAQKKYDEAHSKAEAIKTAELQYKAEIERLEKQNAELNQRLTNAENILKQLQAERNSRNEKNNSPMRDFGSKQKTTAGQYFNDATKNADKYNAKLEQVKAREQAIGNIQSFVQRWFSVYAAARLVSNAFKSMKTNLQDLDDIMTQISIVTDKTQGDLWKQMPQYTDMAKQYASSIKGVYEVSQLYYQQGLGQNDVMALTEQTLKMAKISGLEYATATDYMTNAVRSFKMEMSDAQQVVDVYSAIAASSATNTAELATAMSKTASSAQAVGSSFENTTAMMAVMIEATRESAENIGSAMKSIISRYGEMTKNPSKLIDSEGEAMSLNKVDTALQSVGISIHDAQGQFRDFDDVITELSGSWDKIDKNTQRYIATVMAGNRQQSRFLALVSNGERLEELTEKAANAEDTATLQVLKTMDSISAKAQQLQTSLQGLYTESGFEDLYKGVLDNLTRIIDTFNSMPKMFNSIPVTAIATFAQLFVNIGSLIGSAVSAWKAKWSTTRTDLENAISSGTANGVQAAQLNANSLVRMFESAANRIKNVLTGAITQGTSPTSNNLITTNTKYQPIQIDKKWTEEKQQAATAYNNTFNAPQTEAIREKNYQQALDLGLMKPQLTFWQQYGTTVSNAARAAGAGLQILSATMDKTTRSGEKSAAAVNLLGGALTTAGYIGMGPMGWAGAAVTAITTLINVTDAFIETSQEKVKRLQEATTKSNNEFLQKKTDYKELDEQIKKVDELKKARFDSAEANKEYLDASNALAALAPELISYLDSEGNAVLDLSKSYDVLSEARRQATESGKEAGQNSVELALAQEEDAIQNYNKVVSQIADNLLNVNYGNAETYMTEIATNVEEDKQRRQELQSILKDFYSSPYGDMALRDVNNIPAALENYLIWTDKEINFDFSELVNFMLTSAEEGILKSEETFDLGNIDIPNLEPIIEEINQKVLNQAKDWEKTIPEARALPDNFLKDKIHWDNLNQATQEALLNYFDENDKGMATLIKQEYNIKDKVEPLTIEDLGIDQNLQPYYEAFSKMIQNMQEINSTENTPSEQAEKAQELMSNIIENREIFEDLINEDSQEFLKTIAEKFGIDTDAVKESIQHLLNISQEGLPLYQQKIAAELNTKNKALENLQTSIWLAGESLKTSDEQKDINKQEMLKNLPNVNDLITQYITYQYEHFEGLPSDYANLDFSKDYSSIVNALTNFYTNLSKDETTKFAALIENKGKYSEEELNNKIANLIGENKLDPEISKAISEYYEKVLNQEKVGQLLEERANKINIDDSMVNTQDLLTGETDLLGADEWQKFVEIYDNIASLQKDGSISMEEASTALEQYATILTTISNQDFIPADKMDEVQNIFENWDDFSLIGLDELRKNLKNVGLNDNLTNQLIQQATDFSKLIPENLIVDFDSLSQKMITESENFSKALSKASKGMDIKDATEMASKLDVSVTDFTFKNGKYFIENAEAIQQAYTGISDQLMEDLNTEYNSKLQSLGQEAYKAGISGDKEKVKEIDKQIIELKNKKAELDTVIEQWGKYQTAEVLLQMGQIDAFLDLLKVDDTNRRTGIEEAIKSGNVEKIASFEELSPFIENIIKVYGETFSGLANQLADSVSKGAISIQKTGTNDSYLESLVSAGLADYTADNQGIIIDVTGKTFEDARAWLEQANPDISNEEYGKLFETLFNAFNKDLLGKFNTLLTDTSVSMKDALAYTLASGKTADEVETVMSELGFTYDEVTQSFINNTKDYEGLKNKLEEIIKESDNLQEVNEAKAKLAKLENQPEKDLSESIENILNNRDKISEDMIKSLANSLEGELRDFDKLISEGIFIKNDDGTYSLDINALKEKIINVDSNFSEEYYKHLYLLLDGVQSSISDATSLVTTGTKKESDINTFVQNYQKYVDKNATADELFTWDSETDSLKLSAIAYKNYRQALLNVATEAGASDEAVANMLEASVDELREAIDISSFLSAPNKQGTARKKLASQIKAYREAQGYLADDATIERSISSLEGGGNVGVNVYKWYHPEATQEELQEAYETNITDYQDALTELKEGIQKNSFIKNDKLQKALTDAGYEIKDGVVTDVGEGNLAQAYQNLYDGMAQQSNITTAQLNAAYTDILTESQKDSSNLIDTIKNGMGMSFSDFEQRLKAVDENLSLEQVIEDIKSSQESGQKTGLKLTSTGVMIESLNDYLSYIYKKPIDDLKAENPEEYISAVNEYREGLINYNKTISDNIKDQFGKLTSANIGDEVNLTYLVEQFKTAHPVKEGEEVDLTPLETALGLAEGELSDGIVKISNDTKTKVFSIMRNAINGENTEEITNLGLDLNEIIATYSEIIKSATSEISSAQNGSILSAETAGLLVAYNSAWANKLQAEGTIVLSSATEYIQAASDIYQSVKESFNVNKTDLVTLNNSFANLIKANNSQDSVVNSILSSAANLSVDTLNNFATGMGRELEDFIDESGKPLLDSIERVGIDSYQVTNWQDYIAELQNKLGISIDNTTQDYINAYIAWLESEANVARNAKEALITSLIPNLERLSYAEIGQIAKTFEMTVEQVLALVENNGDNTFNAKDLLNVLPIDKTNEEFARALSTQLQSVTSNMTSAMVAFVEAEAGADGERTDLDISNLNNAISDFEKGMQALGQSVSTQNIDLALVQGGEAAVVAAEQIAALSGQELSASDVATLYQGQVSKLVNAIDTVVAQPGEIVDAVTASLIGFDNVNEIGNTGQYVVETAANLYEAYNKLLQRMAATGEATLANLNKVTGLALDNKDGQQVAIDALGDAANLTYSRLGEIFTSANKLMTEELIQDWTNKGLIKALGGNKIQITDFAKFADLMGFNTGSPEYVSAFKTYNDSLIEMNRQAERNILEEATSVADAKGGDWINLTQLYDKVFEPLKQQVEFTKSSGAVITAFDRVNQSLSKYGGFIEDGILKLEPSANIPAIMQEIARAAAESGGLLSNELAELADAVADTIKGYADLISGAISGSLSNVQAEQLQDWATANGIGDLNFTQTADGLKVAKEQAFELVNALKQVDSMQGKLTFDNLVDSLSADKGGRFENISKTTAEIAKTQRDIQSISDEIAAIEQRSMATQGQMNQFDKEKISNLRQQKSELQNQLSLYQQIQQRQSTDPSQYNFMDRELPEVMQGPINYWNSIGQAFSAMNEAGQTGRMAINDFYNIVTEMENLANTSGQAFNLAGYQIGGEASQAAQLIQDGLSSLTNIDGKGVKVNLAGLGIDFASGADEAKSGFAEGIHSLAQSQIDMLDAAIKVLEVVVAMEELGNIEVDGEQGFTFGDIFNIDEPPHLEGTEQEWYDFTEEYNNWRKTILDKLNPKSDNYNEDLASAINSITVNGVGMKQLLEAGADQIKELGISQQEYFGILEGFVKAAQSGDYDLDTIQDTVWETLKNSGLTSDLTVDVGETTIVISGGTAFSIDWNSEGAKEGEKLLTDRLNEEITTTKEALKAASIHYQHGEADTVEIAAVLSAKGLIKIDSENGKVEIDGMPVDLNSPRGQQYIAEKAMEDAGVEDITSKPINLGNGNYSATAEGTINIGDKKIKVTYDKGNITYHSDSLGKDFGSIDELTHAEYDEVVYQLTNANQQGANIEIPTYEQFMHQKYGITVNTETKFTNADGSEADPTTDPQFQQDLADFFSQSHNTVQQYLNDKSHWENNGNGTYTLELPLGEKITVSAPDIESAADKVEAETKTTIMPIVNSVKAGIAEAFTDTQTGVSAAITSAIQSALGINTDSGKDGESSQNTVPIPGITLAPTGLKIDLSSAGEPTLSNGEEELQDIQIPEITLKPETINVDTASFDAKPVAQEIANAIQEALKEKPITPNIEAGPSEVDGPTVGGIDTSSITSGFSDAINAVTSKVKDISKEASKITADNVKEITKAENQIGHQHVTEIGAAEASISSSHIGAVRDAANAIQSQPAIDAKNAINQIAPPSSITTTFRANLSKAKGTVGNNVALAGGQNTLMGELGPELVVSHGRYFLVGQNGAEFVNLDKDAIVFNHLQTRKLMEQGAIGSYGRPITNDRNAVSMAGGSNSKKQKNLDIVSNVPLNPPPGAQQPQKIAGIAMNPTWWNLDLKNKRQLSSGGNAHISYVKGTGPAMASASAALEALKRLRAMWQSLLGAGLDDLGALGGSGGGGGGGGGGGADEDVKSILDKVEKWYNLLQKIEGTQRRINILQKEYTLLGEGQAYTHQRLNNLQEQYAKRQKSIADREKLIAGYEEDLATERAKIEDKKLGYSAFFDFDEDGNLQLAGEDNFSAWVKEHGATRGIKQGKEGSLKVSKSLAITTQKEADERNARNKALNEKEQITAWRYNQLTDEEKANFEEIKDEKTGKITYKRTGTLKTDYKVGDLSGKRAEDKVDVPKTGLELMSLLQTKDDYRNNIYDSEAQFDILKQLGFEDMLGTLEDGTKLDLSTAEGRAQAVEAFIAKINGEKEAYEQLTQQIQEQTEAKLDDEIAVQEINDQIKELATPVAGVTEGLDKWHNRLREITKLQNNLNRLTKTNTLLQNDGVANGRTLYGNLQKQLANIKEQVKANASLAAARRKDAQKTYNKSGLKNFLERDETGAVSYRAFDTDYLTSINQVKPEPIQVIAESPTYIPPQEASQKMTGIETAIEESFGTEILEGFKDRMAGHETKYGEAIPEVDTAKIKFTRSTDLVRNEEGYLLDTEGQYVDSKGQLHNKEGEVIKDGHFGQLAVKKHKENRGTFKINKGENMADVLERLTKQDANGKTAYTAEEQFQILTAMGLGDMMQYDESGNRIYDDLASITPEQMKQAVENGIARIQSTVDDINEQVDSAEQLDQENLELRAQAQEIVQSIIDNQMELENKVLQAVEDLRQTEIDNAQKERDAYAEATNNLIDGLSSQLQKERDMYSQQQDQDEVTRLQRQIAILQRSGGSGSQIQSLQDQLASKQQDMYFDQRQAQIDQIKDASDLQLERMDHQIEIMTETLQYEKENGLLWSQVYDVMSGTPTAIAGFIAENTKEYASYSALALQQQGERDLEMAQMYKESVKEGFDAATALETQYKKLEEAANAAKAAADTNSQAEITDADENSEDEVKAEDKVKDAIETGLGEEGAIAKKIAETQEQIAKQAEADRLAKEQEKIKEEEKETQRINDEAKKEAEKEGKHQEEITAQQSLEKELHTATKTEVTGVKDSVVSSEKSIVDALKKKRTLSGSASTNNSTTKGNTNSSFSVSLTQYKTGGLNTKPGLAWLDGTPTKPEYVLNADQTAMLKDALFMSSAVSQSLSTMSAIPSSVSSIYDSIREETIEIGSVSVNVNVPSVSSDYDSRRIGEIAMEEMMQIARKHGARGLSRR